MTNPETPRFSVSARIYVGDRVAVGPQQAMLLAAIDREGSISAAGRALSMSYRTTWLMVDEINRCWRSPLVATAAGGRKGGGSKLTKMGRDILEHYENMQRLLDAASQGQTLSALMQEIREPATPGGPG